MREICPACGSDMAVSRETFATHDGPEAPVIVGVEHLVCPECGEITFRPDHLDEIDEYRKRQRAAEGLPSELLSFPVDSGTMRWLESESARIGIGVERIAGAMMLKARSDAASVGAPARAAGGDKKGDGLPTVGNS